MTLSPNKHHLDLTEVISSSRRKSSLFLSRDLGCHTNGELISNAIVREQYVDAVRFLRRLTQSRSFDDIDVRASATNCSAVATGNQCNLAGQFAHPHSFVTNFNFEMDCGFGVATDRSARLRRRRQCICKLSVETRGLNAVLLGGYERNLCGSAQRSSNYPRLIPIAAFSSGEPIQ